jgi:MFS transporter, UMF1 family
MPATAEAGGTRRAPRYSGEDTSLTTVKELWGWYSSGLAAEVYAVCGVGKQC